MQEEATTSIVKSDRLGRTHYSADYKAQVLDAFATSSLSGPAFAKQCGIKYPTFASWVAKQKRDATTGERNDGVPAFMVAEVAENSVSNPLAVHLPGGAVARISSLSELPLLAALIKALA
jgi:hypothetical protein